MGQGFDSLLPDHFEGVAQFKAPKISSAHLARANEPPQIGLHGTRSCGCDPRLLHHFNAHVTQWQSASSPTMIRRFDSCRALHSEEDHALVAQLRSTAMPRRRLPVQVRSSAPFQRRGRPNLGRRDNIQRNPLAQATRADRCWVIC